MVTWENYEEYMLMHADGELQAAEEQELMAFVAQHPELEDELELCAAVKLVPDTTMVYANKEALMKPVPVVQKKAIVMPMWQRYAVAAGVAAIICLSVLKFNEQPVGNDIAGSVAVASKTTGSEAVSSNTVGGKSVGGTAVKEEMIGTPKMVSKHEVIVAAKHNSVRRHDEVKKGSVQEPVVAYEQIAALMPVETKAMPVEGESMKLVAVNAMPVVSVNGQDDSKRTLLESLPIEDIKKEGMNDMANVLAKTYKKVNALRRGITDEKNISVRVEKKQLILSF